VSNADFVALRLRGERLDMMLKIGMSSKDSSGISDVWPGTALNQDGIDQ